MGRLGWLEHAFDALLPATAPWFVPARAGLALEAILERALVGLGLLRRERAFNPDDLPLRSALFVKAARERGLSFTALRGPWGYTNHLAMRVRGKTFRIEGLPNVAWLQGRLASYADDKWKVKKILSAHGFPVVEGRTFWQWQKGRALRYGSQTLGFPLVVKPRNGSVAEHVTINIQTVDALREGLRYAFAYSPVAIVEKHVAGFVHRLTVVDDRVFCMRQLPAHIDGDGIHTIMELVTEKNARPERQMSAGEHVFFHPIILGIMSEKMLGAQNRTVTDIPAARERVWLAADPFMRNGGDLEELTERMHPENRDLARKVAELFGMKLVALDFMCEDIARPWQEQRSAILELNSLPSIETHHFPSYGTPQDVARAIVDMTMRYYI